MPRGFEGLHTVLIHVFCYWVIVGQLTTSPEPQKYQSKDKKYYLPGLKMTSYLLMNSLNSCPMVSDVMSLPILQIAAIVPVTISLVRWRAGQCRRNAQSWDSLVARLKPGWSSSDLSVHFLSKEGLNATPEETWERMQGFRGIRAMYP